MNSILMIVIAIVILLLVFVMFSLDDGEEDVDFIEENTVEEDKHNKTEPAEILTDTNVKPATEETRSLEDSDSIIDKTNFAKSDIDVNDDLKLRLLISRKLPLPVNLEVKDAAIVAIQLRFDDAAINQNNFLDILKETEIVFKRDFSFLFSSWASTQLNRFWVFGNDEGRDDYLFEALVDAFELISRFKILIENNEQLREAKAKISIGVSFGKVRRFNRGLAAQPSWVGKPLYMAETLAEAAGDLSIYADKEVYNAALPLFDFREWKPIKLRSPLPPVPLFELVGWNKPSEIAEFASSDKASARKAVAVAYRYLELDTNIQPIIELLSDSDESVAFEALETVKTIGSKQVFSFLKKIFLEAQDPLFKSKMVDAFASIGNSEIVPVILGSTKEKSWKVRLSAVKALYKLSGSDAVRHIEPLTSDSDPAVRACANGIMAKETGKSSYLKVVQELLSDLSVRGRKVAFDELLEMDNDVALEMISDSFCEQDTELQKYVLRKLEYSKCKSLYKCFLTIFKKSDAVNKVYVVESIQRAEMVN